MSHWAISDLHGCLDIWEQILHFVNPEDKIIVCGDCVDRGPEPFETLRAVLSAGPNVTMLMGNHEDMFAQSLLEHKDGEEYGYFTQMSISNGGYGTFLQWQRLSGRYDWAHKIQQLPLFAEYTNTKGQHIILNHSGYWVKDWNNIAENEYDSIIWDRTNVEVDKWPGGENDFIVHGHTPIPAITPIKEVTKPLIHRQGHSFNIDAGTYATWTSILLNLDTFEEQLFHTSTNYSI